MNRHDDQTQLLRDLTSIGSSGKAEGEDPVQFARRFYPVPEHAKAFDPNVVLIVGPRGSGKSELFRAATELQLLPAISRFSRTVRMARFDAGLTRWHAAYPIQARFPDAPGLARFLDERKDKPSAIIELWFAYLIRVLWNELDPVARAPLSALYSLPGADAGGVHSAFLSAREAPLLALDQLDASLQRSGESLFIGYDELDTLGSAVNWATLRNAVSGLLGFWSTYARRWQHIRAKIFIRTDLYRRGAELGGADFSKLAANRAEISWSDRNLYGMLIKRIANSSNRLRSYCVTSGISLHRDPDLSYVPDFRRSDAARRFVERMIGPYMGANLKKGMTFRWLLDHVRDGRGSAFPRPLVRVIEQAAVLQLDAAHRPRLPKLLEPTLLRRALDKISEEHVLQVIDEWPWMPNLAVALRGSQVPWDGRQILAILRKQWSESLTGVGRPQLPAETPDDLLAYLTEVGVFRLRADQRYDVPDLYLAGFGVKRKGGVRKN